MRKFLLVLAFIIFAPTQSFSATEDKFFEVEQKANTGDAGAQYQLGQMYLRGSGVPKDYNTSLQWITKSAQQGNANAQRHLCRHFTNEEYLPENMVVGLDWCLATAKTSTDYAFIGRIYEQGLGTPKNLVQSYLWYGKDPSSFDSFDAVTRQLTPGELASAKKLLAEDQDSKKPSAVTDVEPIGVYCALNLYLQMKKNVESCMGKPKVKQDLPKAYFWLTLASNHPILKEITAAKLAVTKVTPFAQRQEINRRRAEIEKESEGKLRKGDYIEEYNFGKLLLSENQADAGYYWIDRAEHNSPLNKISSLRRDLGPRLTQDQRLEALSRQERWKPSAEGNKSVELEQGKMLLETNPREAVALIEKAAMAGDIEAQYLLGKTYAEGGDVASDAVFLQEVKATIAQLNERIRLHKGTPVSDMPKTPYSGVFPSYCSSEDPANHLANSFKALSREKRDNILRDILAKPGAPSLSPCI